MSREHVQQIKDRLDVADVVGGYVKLTKAGVNYKGLCPFHQEKSPSFIVNTEKQIFHCFGCSEGGDILTFVQKIEGIGFRESLVMLADRAGVELPRYKGDSGGDPAVRDAARDKKARLYEVLEAAAVYFSSLLEGKQGSGPREYLDKRGLTMETIKQFRVGFVPDLWHMLDDELQRQKFTREEMLAAGLLTSNESGRVYDRFRGRIIFPICDVQGRVIGFTGRVYAEPGQEEPSSAKYLNTPQTDVYNKSVVLYGIHEAKLAIRKQDYVVLVEGQMDVLMSHQAGFAHTVAVSGTALTEDHLRILKRYTKNVMLAFDMDEAGERAAKRSVEMALQAEWNVKVLSLDGGKDAADAILEDVQTWKDALAGARPVMDHYIALALKQNDVHDVMGKKRIGAAVLSMLRFVLDPIEQTHYLQKLSSILNVPDTALRETFQRLKADQPSARRSSSGSSSTSSASLSQSSGYDNSPPPPPMDSSGSTYAQEQAYSSSPVMEQVSAVDSRREQLEERVVALFVHYHEDIDSFDLSSEYIQSEQWLKVLQTVAKVGNLTRLEEELDRSLHNALQIGIIKVEQFIEESLVSPLEELQRSYSELVRLSLEHQIQRVQQDIRIAEEQKDEATVMRCSIELQELLQQLSSL